MGGAKPLLFKKLISMLGGIKQNLKARKFIFDFLNSIFKEHFTQALIVQLTLHHTPNKICNLRSTDNIISTTGHNQTFVFQHIEKLSFGIFIGKVT